MIDAAQRRLESLTATNPLVLELAGADDVEARWQELDLATQRRVISLIVEPLSTPSARAGRDTRASRGTASNGCGSGGSLSPAYGRLATHRPLLYWLPCPSLCPGTLIAFARKSGISNS